MKTYEITAIWHRPGSDPGGGSASYSGEGSRPMSGKEREYVRRKAGWATDEYGYLEIASTKPQTLGVALNDSPAGLASWIIEKWRSWSDCKGDVERKFGRDRLLDTVTLYWVRNSITTSLLDYFDNRPYLKQVPGYAPGKHDFVGVPTGYSAWPKGLGQEIDCLPPREWLERLYNIVYWSEPKEGGHFAALEEPVLYSDDLRSFFLVAGSA